MDVTSVNTTPLKRSSWRRVKDALQLLWLVLRYFFGRAVEALRRDLTIITNELDLFLGAGLFLFGLLGFESGRYCDGNIGNHPSCTRPATFYYFDGFDITLIVLGIFFILVWYFKSVEKRRR